MSIHPPSAAVKSVNSCLRDLDPTTLTVRFSQARAAFDRSAGSDGRQVVAFVVSGSYLHGTAVEGSDVDLKGVYLPSAEDILLGRKQSFGSIAESGAALETDIEMFSLSRFLELVALGQTNAVEMLFADSRYIYCTNYPLWLGVAELARSLIPGDLTYMFSYAVSQARVRVGRPRDVAALDAVIAELEKAAVTFGDNLNLLSCREALEALSRTYSALSVVSMAMGRKGNQIVPALTVAGKSVHLTQSIAFALDLYRKTRSRYGARAATVLADGSDFKAMAHAIRIGEQAIEMASSGVITLPRPNAPDLIRIKLGMVDPDTLVARFTAISEDLERFQPTAASGLSGPGGSKTSNRPRDIAIPADVQVRIDRAVSSVYRTIVCNEAISAAHLDISPDGLPRP